MISVVTANSSSAQKESVSPGSILSLEVMIDQRQVIFPFGSDHDHLFLASRQPIFKSGSLSGEPFASPIIDRLITFFLLGDVHLGDHTFTGGRIHNFNFIISAKTPKVERTAGILIPVPVVVVLIRFCRA